VVLSHVTPLSHVLPCFPTMKLSFLHQWSLNTHISFIWSLIVETFSAMNPILYFLHIYHLDFPLEEKFLPSNSKKILWSNKFMKVLQEVSPCDFILFENQDDMCFIWEFGFWILTTWPFHSCTLAYYSPIYLISIEFQNIDNNLATPPKKIIPPFDCYNLTIGVVTLVEIFSTNY
jgi:hypothetical protein